MELTQDSLQHLLEDLSSFIQTFLFLLGILLIITPLVLTFSHHDWALLPTPISSSLQLKCHHLYKRFCHYSHLWILVALEELGLFGLLDTLFFWLPNSNDHRHHDDEVATSLFPSNDSAPLTNGSQKQHQHTTGLNHQLANVCIRGPEKPNDYPFLVPGLVNTGNTCYLNSILQALSSLPRLQVYLDHINHQHTDQHLPVTRSLYKTLRLLSRPLVEEDEMNTKNLAFRPVDIVSAVNANHRVINREQQDAHELFQLLSGALEAEGLTASKGRHVDKGLKHLLSSPFTTSSSPGSITPPLQISPPAAAADTSITTTCFTTTTTDQHYSKRMQLNNPLTGLLANRLSCTTCGYTEAIRHFSFNNIQLTLPQTASTSLYGCLEQLTAMEYLDDVTCRKCSMEGSVQRLGLEVDRLKQQAKEVSHHPEKKRTILSTLVQVEMQHRDWMHQLAVGGSIQDDQWKKYKETQQHIPYQVHSGQSTKQVMVAKPPKVLCLHISRSTFHPTTGVIYKNKCQLEFPEYLDMARFCTNGSLLTAPGQPISQQQQHNDHPLVEDEIYDGGDMDVKYKLMSIIVHYGSHSCGHFIAYKRRVVADDCGCDACGSTCPEDCVLRASDTWYRISDENVDVCTIDEVLQANPYMLLYESIDPLPPSTYHHHPMLANTNTVPTTARIVVSTENNTMPPLDTLPSSLPASVSMIQSLSTSSSSSSLSSSSTALSSSSSTTTLPTPPSPSTSNDLLAVSPSSSSSSSCPNQKHSHIGSSHLVHRNQDRRKLDWQESSPPLVIY